MSLINNPLYDGDIANKKYVDDAISEALSSYTPSDEETDIDVGNKNFGAQPNPPYHINDTWTKDGEVWICVTERLVGEYNSDDWVKLIDTNPYDDFINNTYPSDKIIIQNQLDSKTETFISADDPATEWVTSLDKDIHVGDFWRKELDGSYETYIYTKFKTDPITYGWVQQDVPSDVWDAIDGKKTIYTNRPNSYEEDDLWIVSETDTDLPDGIIAGDYLVATQSSDVYDKTHWTKANSNVEIEQVKKHFYTKEEIDTTVETVRGDVTKEITETVNGFKTEVSQEYATITTVNSVIKDLEDLDTEVGTISEKTQTLTTKYSELEQTQEEISLSVGEIEKTTNETVVKLNKTIKQIIPYYAVSSSNVTPPSTGWETTVPTRPEGFYMWRKDLIIYQDDTSEYATAYVVTGDKGETGPEGPAGTGVTILGSYDSYEDLIAEHPTGSLGDSYLINGDLYVWSETDNAWTNVGNIQGPAGENGQNGQDGKDAAIQSETAPEDTTQLWYNTAENVLYRYNPDTSTWIKVNNYDEAIGDLGDRADNTDSKLNDVDTQLGNVYNKNEIDGLLSTQEQEIVKKYEASFEIGAKQIQSTITEEIQKNGVTTVKNSYVTIDENGLNVSDNTETFNAQIKTVGFYCNDGDISLVEVTKDGSKLRNTTLKGRTNMDGVMLYEKYKHQTLGVGLAHFYIGEE